jgi:predicted DNA repair protein MutK
MSGLLALLDDVAAIAKVAASSIDDIVGAAAKSGAKAAGVVIDDAAVTPKYAQGFAADRELPIIWRISLGSLRNKLLILLPAALILSQFLPGAITPLLMLGGLYLCFEGAEKLFHAVFPHDDAETAGEADLADPTHLEEAKVAGAIKTDFVLSAEIMTIALSAIPESALWIEAITLALVGIGITVLVYGSVALIVKMDDIGLFLARNARLGLTRAAGRGLVLGMPKLMSLLSMVGTAAMLWVGGSILIHGLEVLGWVWPAHTIEGIAEAVAHLVPVAEGAVHWIVTAAIDFVIGTALGFVLIPLATKIIVPLWTRVAGKQKAAH